MEGPLTLLIVDGHEHVRQALAQRLERLPGVTVLAAVADVRSAAPLIKKLAPDLVLCEPRTLSGDPLDVLRVAMSGERRWWSGRVHWCQVKRRLSCKPVRPL
jgi:DNA-binding NarL/FixJ family response regulator